MEEIRKDGYVIKRVDGATLRDFTAMGFKDLKDEFEKFKMETTGKLNKLSDEINKKAESQTRYKNAPKILEDGE